MIQTKSGKILLSFRSLYEPFINQTRIYPEAGWQQKSLK